jgi:NSS family neurotransmitter:Na+ symporter
MARIMQQNPVMSIAARSAAGAWGSRTTFVLALSTSAIGLGNLWRFSYLLGEHGGGRFVLVYVASLLLVAAPVLIAEIVVGSHGRRDPVGSLLYACERAGATRLWAGIGWLACLAALLILGHYSVVSGWGVAYLEMMDAGAFSDDSAAMVGRHFQELLADPQRLVYYQTIFIVLVFSVSALGIHRGLGVLVWFVVPGLLVVLGVLIDYSLSYGDLDRAGDFLFSSVSYDFTAGSVLIAMGHAFFTLGIGVGVGISLGAYAPDKTPIGRAVLAVVVVDTAVALAAGVAIFPIVFANNVEPGMGPGLMFVSLPFAFGNMPQGEFFGTLFFAMVCLVGVASAVVLAEPPMAYLCQRLRLNRPLAAVLLGGLTWMLAFCAALSFNQWSEAAWYRGMTFFQLLDWLAADLLLPVIGLLTALLVGFAMSREVLRIELYRESPRFFFLWRACLRYIAPPAIAVIMFAAAIEAK